MSNRTVFISKTSYDEAIFKAKMAGYVPVGSGRNNQGEFVIFAQKLGVV